MQTALGIHESTGKKYSNVSTFIFYLLYILIIVLHANTSKYINTYIYKYINTSTTSKYINIHNGGMCSNFLFLIFWLCHAACTILVSQLGMEPVPLQWKSRVLTTGLSGKSLKYSSNRMCSEKMWPEDTTILGVFLSKV